MNRFGFQWPDNLDCSRFPVSGLCVGENRTKTTAPGGGSTGTGRADGAGLSSPSGGVGLDEIGPRDYDGNSAAGAGGQQGTPGKLQPECPMPFITDNKYFVQVFYTSSALVNSAYYSYV